VCGCQPSRNFCSSEGFTGFFCGRSSPLFGAGPGQRSIFKIIPTVMGAEAGPVIGFVSCLGALGGFFPPLLLGWCLHRFGSPAWAYTAMALFSLGCFALNWAFYWRRSSPTQLLRKGNRGRSATLFVSSDTIISATTASRPVSTR